MSSMHCLEDLQAWKVWTVNTDVNKRQKCPSHTSSQSCQTQNCLSVLALCHISSFTCLQRSFQQACSLLDTVLVSVMTIKQSAITALAHACKRPNNSYEAKSDLLELCKAIKLSNIVDWGVGHSSADALRREVMRGCITGAGWNAVVQQSDAIGKKDDRRVFSPSALRRLGESWWWVVVLEGTFSNDESLVPIRAFP